MLEKDPYLEGFYDGLKKAADLVAERESTYVRDAKLQPQGSVEKAIVQACGASLRFALFRIIDHLPDNDRSR